jgi:hypothetical protein
MFRTPITSKPLALLAAIALQSASPAFAEDQVACTILGCERVNIEPSPFATASDFSVRQVWDVVNEILSVSGLAPNFQVIETEEVGNAAAVIIEKERYLAFNPVWMDRYRNDPNAQWQLYAVMAHEVGHHLQGHTLTGLGSRPPTELEADEYAGFTLAALGASLDQALSLWQTLDVEGSATHPARSQRLEAVTRGWNRGTSRANGALANNAPVVTRAEDPIILQMPRLPDRAETCLDGPTSSNLELVCVSSVLKAQSGNSYGLENLFDTQTQTAWVEGVKGHGIGEYIAFEFSEPETLSEIELVNGYAKSDKIFAANGRIKELQLTFSNGDIASVYLDDTSDPQIIEMTGTKRANWLRLEITDVYEGSRWADTAISELRLR